jgi:Rod binding domain-containing protein
MKIAAVTVSPGPAPKLAKAAREFEAILLQNWLEKMNKSFAGEADSQDPAHDTLRSMGAQAVASALSERGGIGLAAMMMRHLQGGPGGAESKDLRNPKVCYPAADNGIASSHS